VPSIFFKLCVPRTVPGDDNRLPGIRELVGCHIHDEAFQLKPSVRPLICCTKTADVLTGRPEFLFNQRIEQKHYWTTARPGERSKQA
jgi:hypothetical protein